MSGPNAIVHPVLAQILLTFVMLSWMGLARAGAMNARRLRPGNGALGDDVWPDDVRKVANNAHNQFETPILFYALCGMAALTGTVGTAIVTFAWGYVGTRIVHSAIHVTTNRVRYRFLAFLAGVGMLMAMWTLIVIRLAAG